MLQTLRNLLHLHSEPCPSCELRRKTLIHMHNQMQSVKNAHSGVSRRVSRFQKDHPELWRLDFTKAGDAEREAAEGQ